MTSEEQIQEARRMLDSIQRLSAYGEDEHPDALGEISKYADRLKVVLDSIAPRAQSTAVS